MDNSLCTMEVTNQVINASTWQDIYERKILLDVSYVDLTNVLGQLKAALDGMDAMHPDDEISAEILSLENEISAIRNMRDEIHARRTSLNSEMNELEQMCGR